jgi:hypothetical protein
LQEIGALEPIITDTATIARQRLESVEPVKTLDGNARDRIGLGHAQIDADPNAAGLIC